MRLPVRSTVALVMVGLAVGLALAGCGPTSQASRAQSAGLTAQRKAQIQQATIVAEQVLAQLQASNIPIGETYIYSASNDPSHLLGTPGQYVGGIVFQDQRLPKHEHGSGITIVDGGEIEVFASQADVTYTQKYMRAISQDNAMFFNEYDYWRGIVLLRVSTQLDPTEAHAYAAAFNALPLLTALPSDSAVNG